MPFESKLAFKYFRSRRKSLARFTSLLAVGGIAAGVAALIIAQSLARGFEDEMRDKILANTAHIGIFLNDTRPIEDWREVRRRILQTEAVENVSPTSFKNVFVKGPGGTFGAVLKVVSDTSSAKVPGAALGEKLAALAGVTEGDAVEIFMFDKGEEPVRTDLRVRRTISTGIYDYDSTWIVIAAEDFAAINGETEFTPTFLSVSVKDIYRAGSVSQKLRNTLDSRFSVVDWQEANRPLFAALSLERKVSLAIISLIIFIAALNITTTLTLLVNERRLDIAVLRTCGVKTKSLMAVFLFEGMFLAAAGIIPGIVLGLAACVAGNRFRVVSIPPDVYSLSYVPFNPSPAMVLTVAGVAFLLSLCATIYPAYRSSRIKPLENLRLQ